MIDLFYVPLEELRRARSIDAPAPERAALFANLCRINTLYMITRAGSGHIGTSFSSIDIVTWLFLNELRQGTSDNEPRDTYFSSKGHDVPALYAVLIALELLPWEKLHQLRRKDGLPGHPDVGIPHMETNTGSLGMGVSKAKGMALANRLQNKQGHFYVLTGDGELQEGQFWESLVGAANRKTSEITAIIDHNKLQSDTFVSRVSDLGDLQRKLESYGWHVARCNGHDMHALQTLFAELQTVTDRPKIVIADTIKGGGVSFLEDLSLRPEHAPANYNTTNLHSGAPVDEVYQRAAEELIVKANAALEALGQAPLRLETEPRPPKPQPAAPQFLVKAYGNELVRQAERNQKIVVFDADLVFDCGLIPFSEQFPERFVECGIAEQDMVSQAGGAALRGLLPLVHSFACFLTPRANEQIYNNATERTKVVYVGSLVGLLPGGPGHSHQSVRDISILAAVPGLTLIEPCDEAEVARALDFCLNRTEESCYLRLVSIPCDIPFASEADTPLVLGRGTTLADGDAAVIFGYGPVLLAEAFKAAQMLRDQHNVRVRVVNLPWLNRVDRDWLRETIQDVPFVFTLDNHYVTGGQGQMLLSELAEMGVLGGVGAQRLGVTRIPVCGQNDEVLRAHGLDAPSLCAQIASTLAAGQ